MFNGQMWVLGGWNGSYFNDVWSSSDGTNWMEATAAAPWGVRDGLGSVVLNGQMWLLGGFNGSGGFLNDAWSSPDGTNWTEATPAAPWSGRDEFGAVVFDEQMWVYGGFNGSNYLNDVWASTPPPLVVSNTNDSGPGSLRQAIANANVGNGGTILFSNVTGTITLTSGELIISNNLAISGPGATNLAISGNNASRVFNINSNTTASISGLTIQDGSTNAPGGALYNLGSLVLSNCEVMGSSSGSPYTQGLGGGIYNAGTMALAYCTVTNNSVIPLYYDYDDYGYAIGGLGGGIYNAGVLTLDLCAIGGNVCAFVFGGEGGGIYNVSSLTISRSSINNNGAGDGIGGGPAFPPEDGGDGGGVYNLGTATLVSSTISGNQSGFGGDGAGGQWTGGDGGDGGGFWNGGSLFMTGCTVSGNTSGNGGDGAPYGQHPQSGGNGGNGGGIRNLGILALTNCTVEGNISGTGGPGDSGIPGTDNYPAANGGNGGSGGGIAGSLAAVNCTVYGNSTGGGGNGGNASACDEYGSNGGDGGNGGSGGGISGGAILVNCTITGNSTGQGGQGGIGVANNNYCESGTNGSDGSTGNGGGINGSGQLLNTIVADDQSAGSGPDAFGSFTSLGYNLIGTIDSNASGFGVTGDLLDVSPLLGPLTNNGGPTFTCALLPGSPAIDAGTCVGAPTYDQRGIPRPQDITCDIGAFELVFACPGDDLCDGIPDSWRAQYFGGNGAATNNLSCATCDADGTGQDNLLKYLVGLNPTNSASVFGIISVVPSGTDLLVTWTMGCGRTNALQATAGDANGGYSTNNFADIFTVTNTFGTTTNYLDTGAMTNVPSRYYRVRLVP